MKKYEVPSIQVINFDKMDIVRTSLNDNDINKEDIFGDF